MSPFEMAQEKSTCCVTEITEFKSFEGLWRPHSILPFINGTQWEELDGTRPSTFWHQHSVLVTARGHYPFLPGFPEPLLSYPSSLHNSFPICQLANTKYWMQVYNLLFKLSPWETMKGHMAQFHWNINIFPFSLWSTWAVRFTNYV